MYLNKQTWRNQIIVDMNTGICTYQRTWSQEVFFRRQTGGLNDQFSGVINKEYSWDHTNQRQSFWNMTMYHYTTFWILDDATELFMIIARTMSRECLDFIADRNLRRQDHCDPPNTTLISETSEYGSSRVCNSCTCMRAYTRAHTRLRRLSVYPFILLSPPSSSVNGRIRRLSPSKFKHAKLSRPAQTSTGIPANHESAPRSLRVDTLFCLGTYADV